MLQSYKVRKTVRGSSATIFRHNNSDTITKEIEILPNMPILVARAVK